MRVQIFGKVWRANALLPSLSVTPLASPVKISDSIKSLQNFRKRGQFKTDLNTDLNALTHLYLILLGTGTSGKILLNLNFSQFYEQK